ncbi:MAG: tyrosine-type recombinase/integrase, partial [Acidobacteria bacterium]|nr:tyrosine-type recombinase/integrase [Acidobacteriota bacterium]
TGASRILAYAEGDALDQLIAKRWKAREFESGDDQTEISAFVFHRCGRPLVDIRKAWRTACMAAGVSGRRFHDLRRSAVRDMVRAGVPETVAMSVTGHRTRSVFDRYDITTGDDQRDALERTAAYRQTMPSGQNVVTMKGRDDRPTRIEQAQFRHNPGK